MFAPANGPIIKPQARRVGIIQPSFIPWRGFFDFINSVDLFIYLDDVQFSKQGWRSRNKIKTRNGVHWLSISVKKFHIGQTINEILIDYESNWPERHKNLWYENYRMAPFYHEIQPILDITSARKFENISDLNIALTQAICDYLSIKTPTLRSSDLNIDGSSTDKLIKLLSAVGATSYLSGPSADAYLDRSLFQASGIDLEYKSYEYDPYAQMWGSFQNHVSILDLIANCGPLSTSWITSKIPNTLIVAGR
jgi:hypothetical protein